MQYQRERSETGKMRCITATGEDFRRACQLYAKLNGESGGQQSKLTRKESELVNDSYNFCWPVRTLQIQDEQRARSIKRTPAMVAGLTDHVWAIEEWLRFFNCAVMLDHHPLDDPL
jgi:hypothetical protein